MLDPIMRALVGVPRERLDLIFNVVDKVGGADGEIWWSRLTTVLREPIPLLDTTIRVNRSIRPTTYPDWENRVLHPELERTGPTQYDLACDVELWLHDDQKNGRMWSSEIYEYLKERKMLGSCLSLRDGEEVQKKGIAVFRKLFQDKEVVLWKSIIECYGHLSVPYLVEDGDGEVALAWMPLENKCLDSSKPALRFAGKSVR